MYCGSGARLYIPHTKNGFTHKEATVQTWNSLDVRMDGQTGRRAAFLSSRLRAPDAGYVLLLCWSAGSRIQVTRCVFSVCTTFFPSLFLSSRSFALLSSLVHSSSLPFNVFLSSYWYRPLFIPCPSPRPQRYHIFVPARFEYTVPVLLLLGTGFAFVCVTTLFNISSFCLQ